MYERLIETISSYIHIEQFEMDLIRGLFHPRKLKKGAFFLQEGELSQQLGFLHRGLVRYYYLEDGEEITYNFGQETDFVCNYVSFFQKTPSGKIIQALEPCEILTINAQDLQTFYQQVREGNKFGRLLIEKNYVDAIQQLASLYIDTPEQRYLKFVSTFSNLQQRIPQYLIAAYVGVKPQSLSRIRKRLMTG